MSRKPVTRFVLGNKTILCEEGALEKIVALNAVPPDGNPHVDGNFWKMVELFRYACDGMKGPDGLPLEVTGMEANSINCFIGVALLLDTIRQSLGFEGSVHSHIVSSEDLHASGAAIYADYFPSTQELQHSIDLARAVLKNPGLREGVRENPVFAGETGIRKMEAFLDQFEALVEQGPGIEVRSREMSR